MATFEEYQKSLKTVQAAQKKTKETGFLCLTINNTKLVFPHAVGVQVLTALDQAEYLDDSYTYTDPPTIRRLNSQDISITPLGLEEYQDVHVAQLLHLSLNDVREMRRTGGDPIPF